MFSRRFDYTPKERSACCEVFSRRQHGTYRCGRWHGSDLVIQWAALVHPGLGWDFEHQEGHTDVVKSVDFSTCGQMAASASADGTARVWAVPSGKLLQVYRGSRVSMGDLQRSSFVFAAVFLRPAIQATLTFRPTFGPSPVTCSQFGLVQISRFALSRIFSDEEEPQTCSAIEAAGM
eukprot:s714_g2.t1